MDNNSTIDERIKALAAENQAVVETIVALKSQLKATYAALDTCYDRLLSNGAQGDVWTVVLEDGSHARFELADNFAEKHVVFRPASVRRWELHEQKEKREKAVKVSEPQGASNE